MGLTLLGLSTLGILLCRLRNAGVAGSGGIYVWDVEGVFDAHRSSRTA
jgi:hypothetical protein